MKARPQTSRWALRRVDAATRRQEALWWVWGAALVVATGLGVPMGVPGVAAAALLLCWHLTSLVAGSSREILQPSLGADRRRNRVVWAGQIASGSLLGLLLASLVDAVATGTSTIALATAIGIGVAMGLAFDVFRGWWRPAYIVSGVAALGVFGVVPVLLWPNLASPGVDTSAGALRFAEVLTVFGVVGAIAGLLGCRSFALSRLGARIRDASEAALVLGSAAALLVALGVAKSSAWPVLLPIAAAVSGAVAWIGFSGRIRRRPATVPARDRSLVAIDQASRWVVALGAVAPIGLAGWADPRVWLVALVGAAIAAAASVRRPASGAVVSTRREPRPVTLAPAKPPTRKSGRSRATLRGPLAQPMTV